MIPEVPQSQQSDNCITKKGKCQSGLSQKC